MFHIDLPELLDRHGLHLRGVIHAGGHLGQEVPLCKKLGAKRVVLFEPVPYTFRAMKVQWGEDPVVTCVPLALGACAGSVTMLIENSNQGQSSSILEPKLHLQRFPQIQFDGRQLVDMVALDDWFYPERAALAAEVNMFVLDVQGYELEALKGAKKFLREPGLECMVVEVNREELYKGCAMVEQVDEFLKANGGFERAHTNWVGPGEGSGDAFYVRRAPVEEAAVPLVSEPAAQPAEAPGEESQPPAEEASGEAPPKPSRGFHRRGA